MSIIKKTSDHKKVKPRRRKMDMGCFEKMDVFLESNASLIMGWVWKSGLLLFLITLIIQNLSFQKENSEKLVESTADIRILSESSKRLLIAIERNRTSVENTGDRLLCVQTVTNKNRADIHYLRRDVDSLLIKKGGK